MSFFRKLLPHMHDTVLSKCTPYVLLMVFMSPKFHPFRSKTSCCWVTCHFEKSAPNDHIMILNPTRSNVPNTLHVLQVSTRPKFHSVSLYHEPFLSYWPFWEKCTKWPQNDLKPYKVKCTPYMCYKYPRGQNFTVSLYDQPFSRYRP